MIQALAFSAHVLAAIIWIGGMFFAYLCLRPSLSEISAPPERLGLMGAVMGRFFRWVWLAIVILLVSGIGLAQMLWGASPAGWPIHVNAMLGIGLIMMLAFAHLNFAPFARMRRALAVEDTAAAAAALAQVRLIVAVNLVLGLVLAVIASAGRYL